MFWADPPACSRGRAAQGYRGENSFPLYYAKCASLFSLSCSSFSLSSRTTRGRRCGFDGDGEEHFGIGVGTLVLTVNVVLLSGYAFGCHCCVILSAEFLDDCEAPVCEKARIDASAGSIAVICFGRGLALFGVGLRTSMCGCVRWVFGRDFWIL